MAQVDKAKAFAALHRKGDPLILFNVWDAGSARAVAEAGAKAIATGSWSVAAAYGFADGEKTPLELVLENAHRIVAAVDLPVSIDFEGAYAEEPAVVGQNINALIGTGAIGCNFEDQIVGSPALYSIKQQCPRLREIRLRADEAKIPFFLNARTDLFLKSEAAQHGTRFDEAIERAQAYADAGANGFFAPGLRDFALIERLCAESPLPVNILMAPGAPPAAELARLGVARISYGPWPYRQMIEQLKNSAGAAFGGGR